MPLLKTEIKNGDLDNVKKTEDALGIMVLSQIYEHEKVLRPTIECKLMTRLLGDER